MPLQPYLSDFHPAGRRVRAHHATTWTDDEPFWPAFLSTVAGSRTASVAFPADPADIDTYATDLHHPDHWPFLTLPLADGHHLHILFRNVDDDAGWDYHLQPAGAGTVITLAALEGTSKDQRSPGPP